MKNIRWWHHQRRPLPLPCASAQPLSRYSRNICKHSRRRETMIMWGCITSWHGHWALSDMVACLGLSAIKFMQLGNCFNAKESCVNVNAFGCFSVSPSSVGFHSGDGWPTLHLVVSSVCVYLSLSLFLFLPLCFCVTDLSLNCVTDSYLSIIKAFVSGKVENSL